jgi:hypothetical protein
MLQGKEIQILLSPRLPLFVPSSEPPIIFHPAVLTGLAMQSCLPSLFSPCAGDQRRSWHLVAWTRPAVREQRQRHAEEQSECIRDGGNGRKSMTRSSRGLGRTSLATSYTCNCPCESPTAKCDPLAFQRNLDKATAGAVDIDEAAPAAAAAAAGGRDDAEAEVEAEAEAAAVEVVDGGTRSNPRDESGCEAPTS